jgi:hypothetical protein
VADRNVRHTQMFTVCLFVCLLFCTFDVKNKASSQQAVYAAAACLACGTFTGYDVKLMGNCLPAFEGAFCLHLQSSRRITNFW